MPISWAFLLASSRLWPKLKSLQLLVFPGRRDNSSAISASDTLTQRQAPSLHTKSCCSCAKLLVFQCDHHFIGVNHIHVPAQQLANKVRICPFRVEAVNLVPERIALNLQLGNLRLPLCKQFLTFTPGQ